MSSSSLSPWNLTQQQTCSDQTTASGLLETGSMADEISCQQSRKDGRTRLVEAMHRAWATRWCMSDYEMSVDIAHLAEEGTIARDDDTLRVHKNLTTPMTFDHSLSPNPRFMKVCFNLYVEIFWPRFPVVHLPSLAPSWENNHLLFFSMCIVGSVFARSQDALDFGNRLRERIGFLIMSKWKSIMSSNSSSTNQMILVLMQMHLDIHSLLLGDSELLAQSISHLGSVVLWARRAGILQDLVRGQSSQELPPMTLQDLPASELHCRWRDWVDEEMKLRVASTLAIIDGELGSIFSHPTLIKLRPERTRPLASDALFAATTAEAWRDIARTEAGRNPASNPLIEMLLPENVKNHWLERILSIATLATEISVLRSGQFNETEIFLH
ncbi:hypothetical protein BKA56DRAFT_133386 [Ilyonectria sp. MPI-CAGE-AT-0026]|nr:hypothetical protein BKA56DRAFT_133386 [Ilyonectria sp. MPI-CAGE-AT-0026]